ncbi:MAG: DUF1189 domain-containing protein [Clostridia bacterium]|nr:DUF1189 domain-containing protein [Clostridia bacterium]
MEKINFFKRVWYSIAKIEKYPELSAHGLARSIGYLTLIVAILTSVICVGLVVDIGKKINSVSDYIENEIPEFTYENGDLTVNSEKVVEISNEDIEIGKIIIDTNDITEETKTSYINQITKEGKGIIILKNETIIKIQGAPGTSTYNYETELSKFDIKSFDKTALVNYINSMQIASVYLAIFLIFFIYLYIMVIILTLINALYISIIGVLATLIIKMKMRYVAVFNMSIYSLTLSIILSMIYSLINMFTNFEIKYFEVMYSAVATIYMVASILLLKENIIKCKMEAKKITEVEEAIKKKMDEEEKEKEREEQEKEKKERKKKDKNEENTGGEPCTFSENKDNPDNKLI